VLSFGGGLHFCVGAALSRMETAVLLPMLFERFPALAPGGTPERRQALRMRMHTRLPVSLRG
jgi:cytochrome P450